MLKQRNRTFGDGKHLQTGTSSIFWQISMEQRLEIEEEAKKFQKRREKTILLGKIKGKKKEQGRKLPQIKGRQRCLKVKWKGKEEKAKKKKKKKNRRRSSRKKEEPGDGRNGK